MCTEKPLKTANALMTTVSSKQRIIIQMEPAAGLGGSDSSVSPSRTTTSCLDRGIIILRPRLEIERRPQAAALLLWCTLSEGVQEELCASGSACGSEDESVSLDPLTWYRAVPGDLLRHQGPLLVSAVNLNDLLSTLAAPGSGQSRDGLLPADLALQRLLPRL